MVAWTINILLLYTEYFLLRVYSDLKTRNYIFIYLVFIHLVFLLVFKDNSIFKDLPVYVEAFDISKEINWNNVDFIQHYDTKVKLEYGWVIYTKLLSTFLPNSFSFLLFTGVFIITAYLWFIKKFSVGFAFSTYLFIVFIFYNSLFVLRQHFAVAILLFSVTSIINRNLFSFIFFQLIAFSIHQSSLIFFPLYFLYGIILSKRILLILLMSSVILSALFSITLAYVGDYFIIYQAYSDGIGDMTSTNFVPFTISCSFLVFIAVTLYPYRNITKLDTLLFVMILVIVVVDYSRIGLTGTLGRLNFYFYPALIILLPRAMKKISNIYFKGFSYLTIVVLLYILMIEGMSNGYTLSFNWLF